MLRALLLLALSAAPARAVVISSTAFRGENCKQCHEMIRDRRPASEQPTSKPAPAGEYDAIVVGGGVSGLTAAYLLKDYRVLVLDKEGRAGGKIRRETYDAHGYPVAGVYMGEPEGRVQDLFKSLGLKIQPITRNEHSINIGGTLVHNWLTEDPAALPYSEPAKDRIRKFQAFLKAFPEEGGLEIPVENSKPAVLERYERSTFRQFVDNHYGPEPAELADLYSRDIFGVGADQISAAAGLEFFASEFTPSFTWEGGLGRASEALAVALGPALSTGSFVWKVAQDLDGVSVSFSRDGRDFEARAQAVVFAVPSLVLKRIAADLGEEKRDALAKVRYSAYAVAPLKIRNVIWKESFIYWTPGRFITDLTSPTPAADVLRGATSQVLVAYAPLGEVQGRRTLLTATDEELTNKILADLESLFPGRSGDVLEARVMRWGHAMPVPYPGFLSKVRPVLARPEGRYFFAGVDTQLPCFEGAVYSGAIAADAARQFLRKRSSGGATPR